MEEKSVAYPLVNSSIVDPISGMLQGAYNSFEYAVLNLTIPASKEPEKRDRYSSCTIYSRGHVFKLVPGWNISGNYSDNTLGLALPWENTAVVNTNQSEDGIEETMSHEETHLEEPWLSELQVRAKNIGKLTQRGELKAAEIAKKHYEDFKQLQYILRNYTPLGLSRSLEG